MECKYCGQQCQKWGRQNNGAQRFYCKQCCKYQQKQYTNKACQPGIAAMVPRLVCNGVGIRGMARVLQIAINTVVKYIKQVAAAITKPAIPIGRTSFEIDELRTFIGNKQNRYWVAYVLCSHTKQVIDFIAGKRNSGC